MGERETNGPMCVTYRASGAGKSWLKRSPGAEETKAEDLPKKVSEEAPAAVNNYKVNRDGAHGHLLGGCTQHTEHQRAVKTFTGLEHAQQGS